MAENIPNDEFHCDICRWKEKNGIPLPVGGPYCAAQDIEVCDPCEGKDYVIPLGTPLIVVRDLGTESDDPFSVARCMYTGRVVAPYWIMLIDGPHAGDEWIAYWCEVARPEGVAGAVTLDARHG